MRVWRLANVSFFFASSNANVLGLFKWKSSGEELSVWEHSCQRRRFSHVDFFSLRVKQKIKKLPRFYNRSWMCAWLLWIRFEQISCKLISIYKRALRVFVMHSNSLKKKFANGSIIASRCFVIRGRNGTKKLFNVFYYSSILLIL